MVLTSNTNGSLGGPAAPDVGAMAASAGGEEGATVAVDSLVGGSLVGVSVDGCSVDVGAVVAAVVAGAVVGGLVERATIDVLDEVVGSVEGVDVDGPMVSGPALVCTRPEPASAAEHALSVVAVARLTSAVRAARHSERRPRLAGSIIRLSVEGAGVGLRLLAEVGIDRLGARLRRRSVCFVTSLARTEIRRGGASNRYRIDGLVTNSR